jgi:hypothetical protein
MSILLCILFLVLAIPLVRTVLEAAHQKRWPCVMPVLIDRGLLLCAGLGLVLCGFLLDALGADYLTILLFILCLMLAIPLVRAVLETPPQKRWSRIMPVLFYNLINLGLVLCTGLIILRGTGLGSILEPFIVGVIYLLSLSFFRKGVVVSVEGYRATKSHHTVLIVCFLMTVLLVCTATLGIYGACSDDKGHCRNWQICFVNCQRN